MPEREPDVEVRNDQIRERAYALWEEAGRPRGCDVDHWLQAEAEIAGAGQNPSTPKISAANRAKNPEKPGE